MPIAQCDWTEKGKKCYEQAHFTEDTNGPEGWVHIQEKWACRKHARQVVSELIHMNLTGHLKSLEAIHEKAVRQLQGGISTRFAIIGKVHGCPGCWICQGAIPGVQQTLDLAHWMMNSVQAVKKG